MMPYFSVHNPFNWRERATEARRLADIHRSVIERDNMLSCAKMYDRLAEMAEISNAAPQKAANDSS